jgi:hypothetical protein
LGAISFDKAFLALGVWVAFLEQPDELPKKCWGASPGSRHWKDHFKSDFRSDQDHLLEK